MNAPSEYLLFVYGTLLTGESAHGELEGANFVGECRTAAKYSLVDLGQYPGMVRGGDVAIVGELYAMDARRLARVDVHEGHPVLFHRETIELEGGEQVQAYVLDLDQTRGRRRIRGGSWRDRDAKAKPAADVRDGAFVGWTRKRVVR